MEPTPAAQKFIRRMMWFAADGNAGFRLKARQGGCSGLAVEFDVAAKPALDETVMLCEGLSVFVDAESRLLLNKATVDFQESISNTGFVVALKGQATQACESASALVSVESLVRR
ncbi:MAG TPA: hypothetical protein VMV98_05485 [Acidobacteriaceae bacterium]|nr:hypothetical protein [Acidobacteriaceae bacterium]